MASSVNLRNLNRNLYLDHNKHQIQEHAALPSIYQNPTVDRKIGQVKTSTYYWMLAKVDMDQAHYSVKDFVREEKQV